MGYKDLARPPSNGSSKGGKIVPSAVLFTNDDSVIYDDDNHNVTNTSDKTSNEQSSLVGYAAIKAAANHDNNKSDDQHTQSSGTLVTSFKRVVGMTSRQAIELRDSEPNFWNSLPFNAVIIDDESLDNVDDKENKQYIKTKDVSLSDVLGGNITSTNGNEKLQQSKPENESQEGVGIQISEESLLSPLQVTTILLQSIRIAASDYLINNNRSKIQAPGLQKEGEDIQNCVIGVPAHYSHAQRRAIQNAAKNAGFAGQVSVMTESTAATMAYGHFVSPNIMRDKEDTESEGKNILVFDMGGGTTDCTITNIDFKNDNVQFRVVATSGNSCLGGDDVDELLARYMWKEHISSQATATTNWKASSEHQYLILACRRAKEELCGNDDKNQDGGVAETQITLHDGKTITITRDEFDLAIQQLIDRAEQVVDDALSVLVDFNQQKQSTAEIHEVVLVGGSTHIPTIRSMLSRKFPPPLELCTSISAETAVGQGLAIQAALLSKTVPLYELRNAMMLDVLPHSIGVWVQYARSEDEVPFTKGQIIQSNNENQGHYIEILKKDSPLPSMASQTFTLANSNQTGVTVIAAEHIGQDVYQCMGVFDFLLCRLHDKENDCKTRQVKIGMVLDASGQFTVSIFDEKDPAHREKRRRYLKEKANDSTSGEFMNYLYEDEEDKSPMCSGTEIALTLFCIVFFALYITARVAFSDMNTMEFTEL